MTFSHPAGTIVYIKDVTPVGGGEAKTRPVILLDDCCDADEFIVGVAVTSEFNRPLEPFAVELPFGSHGKCKTGLTKPSIAHCEWIVKSHPSDVCERVGYVTDDILLQIAERLPED